MKGCTSSDVQERQTEDEQQNVNAIITIRELPGAASREMIKGVTQLG